MPIESTVHGNCAPLCRYCKSQLHHTFVDLGLSPLCESYVERDRLNHPETFYPLHVYVCEVCFLVQLESFVSPDSIFVEYAYFSSYSDSWVEHARQYVDQMVERFRLGPHHSVIEIASNDGYLLQHLVAKGIPCLGIEPAANVAQTAMCKGIPTLVKFFGQETARSLASEGRMADLLVANNVLAHVPDLNDFVKGMTTILNANGVITLEFPHLMRLMAHNQFDTIYHEHFSYFSFLTAFRVLAAHELTVFDVEELSTHGGSLRVFAKHANSESNPVSERVGALLTRERDAGFDRLERYLSFRSQVEEAKRVLLQFLINAKREGRAIAGYGAPGKGNTLLNYCGIRTDILDYTVDRNPYKQGKFLPGTRIPIYAPERLLETKPDYILVLPWNLKDEIMKQCAYIREWGGRFVVPIPEVRVYE